MANDLVERYIYAVTKKMSPKLRDDVAEELRGLVDDMLLERCGDAQPAEKDIRVVLTELGSPQELYAKYDQDAQKCLIGQPYYSTYKLVLKTVLACVAFGLTVACGILQLIEPKPWLEAVGFWLSEVFDGLLASFTVLTILFAVASRKGLQLGQPFNFDELPPVPEKRQTIHWLEPVIGIAFEVVFTVLLLAVPQVFSVFYMGQEWVPIFSVEILQSTWLLIVLLGLCGTVRELVRLLEKRYNMKVLVTTLIANSLSAVLAILWLNTKNLMDPGFIAKMAALMEGKAAFLQTVFRNIPQFFLFAILLALLLDTLEAAIKTLRK